MDLEAEVIVFRVGLTLVSKILAACCCQAVFTDGMADMGSCRRRLHGHHGHAGELDLRNSNNVS
jgi:hypothetical protein